MAENSFKPQIEEAKADIRSIVAEVAKADKEIVGHLANIREKFQGTFKITTPEGLNTLINQLNDSITKLNTTLNNQTNNTDKLNTSKRRLNELTSEERVNQRQLAKNSDLQAQATSKLVGAYANLIAKRQIAKKALQDAISAEKQNTKEIRRAQKEYDKLSAKINQANAATSNFTKNSLGGAVRGFRNLLGAFGVVGGAYLIADFTKKIFSLAKTLDSLRFAMENTIKDTDQLAMSQAFLSDISERYGQNILTLTERFIKFRVAAEQSNVSFGDTIKIFESFTKVAGVLGLKTDELNGIFLALEQMLSKGKVTTEELRRQLGERLPGAFGITAEVLKVTMAELDKMLKAGEVLSAETLPKLADGVVEAFNLETVDRIETLSAETQRFSNAWTELVAVITKSEGPVQAVFINLARFGTHVLKSWEWIFSSRETILSKEFEENRLKGYRSGLKEISDEAKRTGKTEGEVARERAKYAEMDKKRIENQIENLEYMNRHLMSQGKLIGENKVVFDKNTESIAFYNQMLGNAVGVVEAFNEVLGKNTDSMDDASSKGRTYQDVLDDIKSSKEKLLESTKEEAPAILETIDALEKEAEAWERARKSRAKALQAVIGSIGWLEQQINNLEEERQKLATSGEAYAEYTDKINKTIEKLRELQSQYELAAASGRPIEIPISLRVNELSSNQSMLDMFGIGEKGIESEFKSMVDGTKATMDKFNEDWENSLDSAEKYAELKLETIKSIFGGVFETFSDMFDFDMGSTDFIFESLLDKEKELFSKDNIDDWANFSKEAINSVLDASLNRYQVELQEAQASRDLILNNDLATEKQKRLAREKFEKEERAIKIKAAKAEKRNNLIKIAADTAAGIVSALAQIPKFDFGISAAAFAGFIAATGAAQAALVAAQPIPEFKDGHLSGTHSGKAVINDANRKDYQEVVERGSGQVEIYKNRDEVIDMNKGDKVHRSMDSFLTYHDIDRDVLNLSLQSHSEKLGNFDSGLMMLGKIDEMRKDFKEATEKMEKLAKRPIQNHNHITVETPYTEYKQ